jgi:hypothetical protein
MRIGTSPLSRGVASRHFKTAKPALPTLSRKATSMTRELVAHNRPTFDQLHSAIPKIAAGLVTWFVLMAWIFFDKQSVVGLPLAFITVLFLVVGLSFSGLFLVSYRHQPDYPSHPNEVPFRDWIMGNFSVWGSQQSAGQAATEILLPMAAAAFGMTAMGTIYAISTSMIGAGIVS